jgi:hypothetical protein
MTFPATIRQIKVEIQKRDASWVDVTSDVFGGDRDQITITYGKTDQAGETAPASCQFSIQNTVGRYSPRNPNSNLYGEVKRNTPIRVSVNDTGTDYRFHGELSSLAPRQDVSGNDAFVLVEAAGLLRRLGQGTEPAESGLRSFITDQAGLLRYWPLTGAADTTYSLDVAGSGSNHKFSGPFGEYVYGVDFGEAWLGTGMAFFNSTAGLMVADVGSSDPYVAIDFVFQTSEMGHFNYTFRDSTNALWSIDVASNGDLSVDWNDPSGTFPTNVAFTAAVPAFLDDQVHHMRVELLKSGADTNATVYIDGVSVATGTQAAFVQAGVVSVKFGLERTGTQSWITLGHITVWSDPSAAVWPSAADTAEAAAGYVGETAGDRIARITALAGQTVVFDGTQSDTQVMGPQFSESKLSQLRDAEAADMGILTEPRSQFGLLYRTHRSLYSQTAALTLQYDSNQLAPPFEPVDDDQYTRNDITAVRRDGGTFRIQQTTGPLSISDPPAGVGRYRDEVTLNVQTDGMLEGVATWLLSIGTLDEARFPSIAVDLTNPDVVAAGLDVAVRGVSIGDLLVIQDADAAFFPDDLSLIVLGYTERIDQYHHFLVFNCMPAAPYAVAAWGSGVGTGPDRYDTDGSALVSGVTSTATSLSVKTTGAGKVLWTTVAGEFPFDIVVAGERMRVTNITSTTSPQAFTVTRSINGIVKAQSADAEVRLFRTPRYAL